MKNKTFEYKSVYYGFIGILLLTIMSLFGCKKEEPITPKILGASWEGYYTDISTEICPFQQDSVHIYYDNNSQLFISGLDYWTCSQSIFTSLSNNVFTIDTYYDGNPGSIHIEANGYWKNDTIVLIITNHIKDGSPILTNPIIHKYIKK